MCSFYYKSICSQKRSESNRAAVADVNKRTYIRVHPRLLIITPLRNSCCWRGRFGRAPKNLHDGQVFHECFDNLWSQKSPLQRNHKPSLNQKKGVIYGNQCFWLISWDQSLQKTWNDAGSYSQLPGAENFTIEFHISSNGPFFYIVIDVDVCHKK